MTIFDLDHPDGVLRTSSCELDSADDTETGTVQVCIGEIAIAVPPGVDAEVCLGRVVVRRSEPAR